MYCRECGERSCNCLLVPEGKLHLESLSWESIILVVSSTLTPNTLIAKAGHFLPAVSEEMDEFFATGSTTKLAKLLRERKECVVGLKAPLPVRQVTVFADAETALRHATTIGAGEWCVALPLGPPPHQEKGIFRGFVGNRGTSVISTYDAYDVISHNWPRTANFHLLHTSVLGIWWGIRDSALRQAESVLALGDLSGRPVWVDFLCLDQENVEEKREWVPKMGRIYAKSCRGFIDCTMAPGVSTVNPEHVKELMNIGDSTEHSYSDEERRRRLRNVVESPWFSRCWTFQEELLTPELMLYDPSQDKVICDFRTLQEKCIQEFHHMHTTRGYDIAKSEGWFTKAASLMNHMEIMQKEISWNLGNVLSIRGRRCVTEESDQINSLLGILDVKCNHKKVSAIGILNEKSFAKFLQECSENGDTSWVVGEDPNTQVPHLSWTPSSPYADFSTQAESSSIRWLSMTKDGPKLRFHRAFNVLAVLSIQKDTDFRSTFSQMQGYHVDGEWMLEYCGVAFGEPTEGELPIPATVCQDLFQNHRGSWDSLEERLISYLPKNAEWRAKELRNYLEGLAGRFNAWIIFETPMRRIAVMAKILTQFHPKEVLFGFPVRSKYKETHSFFPVMIVDDFRVRRRVGWAWPCVHASLKGEEAKSEECIRYISN